MTRQILFAGLAGVISLFSLLSGSGIGQAYHLYPMAMAAVIVCYAVGPFQRVMWNGSARNREFFLFVGLTLMVGVWPAIQGNGMMGVNYGWLLLLPYVVGQFRLSRRDIRAVGFACGAFGLLVLVARLYLGVFINWNRNDIAIAGFFSCAVFSSVDWSSWGEKIFSKILLIIVAFLIFQLDSRSCLIGMLILIAFSFGIINRSIFVRKKWLRRLLLILPAVIAVGTVLFQNSELFDTLNAFSMEYFSKPIFNGRNTIWEQGVQTVIACPWLGTGTISNGYWHNCAITAMTAFGIIGYIVWVLYFENIMVDSRYWKDDPCLGCSIVAFLVIMLEQSFELGLISTTGSMMPYLLLGLILGRIRYLKEKRPVRHAR